MPYFSISQSSKTMTIKNKKRISLIVPYKSSQLVIFYQDCSYEHRQVFGNKLIHEGKLKYLVTQLVKHNGQTSKNQEDYSNINKIGQNNNNKSDRLQYICLIGRKNDVINFGILNIQSKLYKAYQSIFHETKQQIESPRYHIVTNTLSKYPLLIQITPNIQNGIMIKCFDFKRNQWLHDILYCGSKFLNYHLVSIPHHLLTQNNLTSFCLISNGQKSQSINCVSISIKQSYSKHQTNQINPINMEDSFISQSKQSSAISVNQQQNNMTFLFNKQIKYYRNFTTLGCYITSNGFLFLIGNSFVFQSKQNKQLQKQPTCLYLNLLNLSKNLDPQYKFIQIKNIKFGKSWIRQYLGYLEQSMIFIIQNSIKRSIHKLSPLKIIQKIYKLSQQKSIQQNYKLSQQKSVQQNYKLSQQNIIQHNQLYDEQIYSFSSYKIVHPQISVDSQSLIYYELVCEQFFEKIKQSPSVIKLNYLLKINKQMYYKQILQNVFQQSQNDQNFIHLVLNCF